MALLATPEASTGMLKSVMDATGLFGGTNKAGGINPDSDSMPVDEYTSSMSDEKILELTSIWKKDYAVYFDPIDKTQKLAFDYWVGKHKNTDNLTIQLSDKNFTVTDNLIFEAIETFLPIATRANPEPLVQADPSTIGQQLAKDIKVALAHEADTQILRRKLAKVTRKWMLDRIGVLKVTWNPHLKKIETTVTNGKKMIFDKDGYVDERGYFIGEYIGEKKRASANTLSQMFPTHKALITVKAGKKKGTMLDYIEWWYCGTDTFYTLDDTVLGKYKNPNWNYDIQAVEPQEASINPETGEELPPVEGTDYVQGTNHLDEPSYPYRFLSIFNLGQQPHDETSLVIQNIPQQDKINRREVQIERNVESMNNGIVVSGTAFTEDQAAGAAAALRRGVAIRVPNGDVQKAVMFPQKPPLPADVFHSLEDARAELRNIFGTAGSSAEGIKSQETVRGKIMVNQADSSRIGGGITEYIEQLADSIYNLWVQMMFVYYDEEHFITAAGGVGGSELIALKNDQFPLIKTLTVTVKEGSLVPKDPLTQRNEAIDLWSANAIDPRSLYQKLDFPDPDEATNQLILWQMLQKGQIQPQQYLSSFAPEQAQGQPGMPQDTPQQPGTGGPAVSQVDGPNVEAQSPSGATAPPVDQASQQLLASQPLPNV